MATSPVGISHALVLCSQATFKAMKVARIWTGADIGVKSSEKVKQLYRLYIHVYICL